MENDVIMREIDILDTKIQLNYYRLFCLSCSIFPDWSYDFKKLDYKFIRKFDNLILSCCRTSLSFSAFKYYYGLYDGKIYGIDSIKKIFGETSEDFDFEIEDVYEGICGFGRLKCELILYAENYGINISEKLKSDAHNYLKQFNGLGSYKHRIECLGLSEFITYRLFMSNIRFVEQLQNCDLDSILEKANLSDDCYRENIKLKLEKFLSSMNNRKRIK